MKAFLRWQIRWLLRPLLGPPVPVAVQRAWSALAAASTKAPPGVMRDTLELGGVPALRLTPSTAQPGRALLYLHGGAYVLGGPASHAKLAAQLGHAAQSTVYFVDYRLAPEHPFPAALDDALAAYGALLAQTPAPKHVVVAGDSAGGGLTMALALALRDRKQPLPESLVLLSPWVDLTLSGDSHTTHAQTDPMLRAAWLAASARQYAGERPLTEPLLSPLFADLAGLPRMLIQVGSDEILRSDSERLAQRAQAAGVSVTLKCFEGLWHDFQAHAGMLPEATAAVAEIGAFAGATAHG